MASRHDELQAKRARLAELKRQRELRNQDPVRWTQSIGTASDVRTQPSHAQLHLLTRIQNVTVSPAKADERRAQVDELVSNLIGPNKDGSEVDQNRRASRHSPSRGATENGTATYGRVESQSVSVSTQTLSATLPSTLFEVAPVSVPRKGYITYQKAVQTDPVLPLASQEEQLDVEVEALERKRQSRAEERREEEIRLRLRKEIEEELKAIPASVKSDNGRLLAQKADPPRTKSDPLSGLTNPDDLLSFIERSSKVIERVLDDDDDDYDVLADYTISHTQEDDGSDKENFAFPRSSRKSYTIKQTQQFFDSNQTRRRPVSDLQFSPHFPELLLSSHTKQAAAANDPSGLIMLWNVHAPSRPEYVFHSQGADILSARFSPFHPNLIIGGCYTGQVCLWDTRAASRTNGAPVLKTPQSGSHLGHNHPVYSISIIGTPNAHNIITASSDGVICSWSVDMLTQPQEYLELTTPAPARNEDLAPTCMTFPASDPTFFVVATEEGAIYPCHRYDRAGAKAGVDTKVAYKGHTAPVTSCQFHPAKGPVDLSDLLLTSSIDWSVKLWRIRPAASSSTVTANTGTASGTTGGPQAIAPVLDIGREDLVYDAKWAPHKPSVFACVTGAGDLEVFDLNLDLEVPVATAKPTQGKAGALVSGLNKCAWEEKRGGFVATGGLDGVVSLFEVSKALSGEARPDEWAAAKKIIARAEAGRV